ncbi:glycylpeptide N-tetradecanoyltransferase [Nematocida sp. AWRm77]|nr:glycylpeptide N-tetradecanoyltransferase [Nematocida sp. AWRm77]
MTQEEKVHEFWSTQPVTEVKEGPVKNTIEVPSGMSLRTVHPQKDGGKLFTLLAENYVEDDAYVFRMGYSKEFLVWQLSAPGMCEEWSVGLYAGEALVGFISAAPIQVVIKDTPPARSAVVNFLCLSREYRKQRLAPLLIKEITRRVNARGVYKALFTAAETLPFVFSSIPYYHRLINGMKLFVKGFCNPMDLADVKPGRSTLGLREATEEDMPKVFELYKKKYEKFSLFAEYTLEQFKYYVMPRKGIVECLVNQDVTEFVSMFYIDTICITDGSLINTGYLYYHSEENFSEMVDNLVFYLKEKEACDLLNTLAIENKTKDVLRGSGFLKGDGVLHYYLFNWKSSPVRPEENGFIPF